MKTGAKMKELPGFPWLKAIEDEGKPRRRGGHGAEAPDRGGDGRTMTKEIRNHGDGTGMKTQGGRLRFFRHSFFFLRAFSVFSPRPPCSSVTPKTPGIRKTEKEVGPRVAARPDLVCRLRPTAGEGYWQFPFTQPRASAVGSAPQA